MKEKIDAYVQEIKASPHGMLLTVIVVMICGFFVWASLSDIAQHVQGQGRIIPHGKTRSIQHLEGGIVREILISEGDRVEKGQTLFVIDNIDASTDFNEAEIRKNALAIRLVRLRSEKDGYKSLSFPEELQEKYPEIIRAEEQLFLARAEEFRKELAVLDEQTLQKKLRLDNLLSTRKNLNAELAVAQQQMQMNKKLVEAGAVAQSRYLETQSRVKNFQTRIEQVEKELPVVRAEQKEIENKRAQVYKQNEADIIEEINEVDFEKRQITERLNSFGEKVSRSHIVAPVAGIVNARYIDTLGGVIQPGGVLADILPLEEQLVVEGRIRTEDRAKIYLDLPVKIRLSAYDFRTHNAVDGRLVQISADSFTDRQERAFYKIMVQIDASSIPPDVEIYPGMMVDLNIQVNKVSVLESILRPFLRLREVALRKI